jgi:hypothetical protein
MDRLKNSKKLATPPLFRSERTSEGKGHEQGEEQIAHQHISKLANQLLPSGKIF